MVLDCKCHSSVFSKCAGETSIMMSSPGLAGLLPDKGSSRAGSAGLLDSWQSGKEEKVYTRTLRARSPDYLF